MASVTSPTADAVLTECGLKDYLRLDAPLNARIASLITDAADATALEVTETFYDSSTLTDRQARQLARAVKLRAAVLVLKSPLVRIAVGTPLPLLQDEEALGAVIDRLQAEAESIEAQVKAGTSTRPYAKPAASSSTFSYSSSSGDRLPSERNRLTDETDDISAWDTSNG